MEQVVTESAPVVEESLESYVSRANAAEKGGTLHEIDAVVDETPVVEAAPVAVAKPVEAKPDAKKPRNDPQARIDQITAKQKEAERKADEATARAAQLERDLAAARAPKPEPVKTAPQTFPDFATWSAQPDNATKPYEDYIRASVRHEIAEEKRVEHDARAEQRATQQLQTSNAQFRERLSAQIVDEPNFLETVDQRLLDVPRLSAYKQVGPNAWVDRSTNQPLPAPTFASWAIEQAYQSDAPKAVLRYLSDFKEFQRLATLPPDQAIRALAKVEHTASAAASARGPARETKPVSHAPDPIQPLGSSAQVQDDTDDDALSLDAFVKRGNARDRKAGRL